MIKTRKISVIMLIVGVAMFATGIIFRKVLGIVEQEYLQSFIRNTCFNFGLGIILNSLFCLIFTKTTIKYCTIKTSIISFGISSMVGMGAMSILLFLSCHFLTSPKKHPIAFPTSILLGSISFLIFILLFYTYTTQRKKIPSTKGTVIDVLFAFLYIHPFLWLYSDLYGIAGICARSWGWI